MFDKLKGRMADRQIAREQEKQQKQELLKKQEEEIQRLMNSNIRTEQELLIVLNAMKLNKWYRIRVLDKVYTINKERDGEYNIQGIKKDYYKSEIVAKLLKRPMPRDRKGNYLRG